MKCGIWSGQLRTNCVLCHKLYQVLADLTFLELGKESGETAMAHSQCRLAYALLWVVPQSHSNPTRQTLQRGLAKPPGGCFLVLRWQMSQLEGTL